METECESGRLPTMGGDGMVGLVLCLWRRGGATLEGDELAECEVRKSVMGGGGGMTRGWSARSCSLSCEGAPTSKCGGADEDGTAGDEGKAGDAGESRCGARRPLRTMDNEPARLEVEPPEPRRIFWMPRKEEGRGGSNVGSGDAGAGRMKEVRGGLDDSGEAVRDLDSSSAVRDLDSGSAVKFMANVGWSVWSSATFDSPASAKGMRG